MSSIDLAAVRTAIANTIDNNCPTIKRVDPYQPRMKAIANMPCAGVWLAQVSREPVGHAQRYLGKNDFDCSWIIEVYYPLRDLSEAQQTFEQLVSELRAAFDSHELLDNSGVVEDAALEHCELYLYRQRANPMCALRATLGTISAVNA